MWINSVYGEVTELKKKKKPLIESIANYFEAATSWIVELPLVDGRWCRYAISLMESNQLAALRVYKEAASTSPEAAN